MAVALLSDIETMTILAPALKVLDVTSLTKLLEVASSFIRTYTGRNLRSTRYSYLSSSEYYDPDNAILSGHGGQKLFLPQYPVTVLDKVVLSNEALTIADISDPATYDETDQVKLEKNSGKLFLASGWDQGDFNIHLVYTAGFNEGSYPGEMRLLDSIVAQFAGALWTLLENSSGVVRSEILGDYSYSIGYNAMYILKGVAGNVLPGHPGIGEMLEEFVRPVNIP